MTRVAIIYYTSSGTIAELADAAAAGAAEFGEAGLCRIRDQEIVEGRFRNPDALDMIDAADGVIFGSPTFMGGPAAQFKAFADATSDRWSRRAWAGKVAGGFTSGSCANGDQSHTLGYFSVLAAQHGMLWCSLDLPGGMDPLERNRLGTQMGVSTHRVGPAVSDEDLLTARYLGQRVARLAGRVSGSPPAKD
ncbi:MAG: flavodoxin family protein [Hyphomonadaceae bacterium]